MIRPHAFLNKYIADPDCMSFDVTISGTGISADTTDVIFVNLSKSSGNNSWWDEVWSNGENIRIFDSAWNELPRDVVWINKVDRIGQVNVKATISSTGSTVLKVVADHRLTSGIMNEDTYGRYNTYTGYELFLELQSDPSASSYIAPEDRTSYRRDVVDVGALSPSNVIVDSNGLRRTNFADNISNIMKINNFSITSPAHTLSALLKPYSFSTTQRDVILAKGVSFFGDGNGSVSLGRHTDGHMQYKLASTNTVRKAVKDLNFSVDNPVSTDLVYQVSWNGTSATDGMNTYVNAVNKGTSTTTFSTLWSSYNHYWSIGGDKPNNRWAFDGEIGVIKIHTGERSADQLLLETKFYLSHGTICTYGAESRVAVP